MDVMADKYIQVDWSVPSICLKIQVSCNIMPPDSRSILALQQFVSTMSPPPKLRKATPKDLFTIMLLEAMRLNEYFLNKI